MCVQSVWMTQSQSKENLVVDTKTIILATKCRWQYKPTSDRSAEF